MYYKTIGIMLFYTCANYAFMLQVPIKKIYTPNSILSHKEQHIPLLIENRLRYATCTSTAWLNNTHIAVVNFYGEKIDIYRFDAEKNEFSIHQTVNNQDGAQLKHPEHIAISHRGTLASISNSRKGLNLYTLNTENNYLNPKPIYTIPATAITHNSHFNINDDWLIYTTYNQNESVCIYKIDQSKTNPIVTKTYTMKNDTQFPSTRAALILDNRFAIIARGTNIQQSNVSPSISTLYVYRFNSLKGILEDLICQREGNFSCEDLIFLSKKNALIFTDQAHDTLVGIPFNPETGLLGEEFTIISDTTSQLSFPHGLSLSPNERYIAVANYGDDSCTVYQVN